MIPASPYFFHEQTPNYYPLVPYPQLNIRSDYHCYFDYNQNSYYYLDNDNFVCYPDQNGNFYYIDSANSIYYKKEDGTFYDSVGEICYLDSEYKIYYMDSVGSIYYKKEDGTFYDSAGEICYLNQCLRIYYETKLKDKFFKIKSPEYLEHNNQYYYKDSNGNFYALVDGQARYPENISSEKMEFIPDSLRTERTEGKSPPYLSDHSIVLSRVTISGQFVFHYAYWNVLSRCIKLNKTNDYNNPWGITYEPDYATRLEETIHKIISIISDHKNLGAFFLQEARSLSKSSFFLKLLKEKNWSLVKNDNLVTLFNENILKHNENIPLNCILFKNTQTKLTNFFKCKAPTLRNRFLISGFCLLSNNTPIFKIHLCSFHLPVLSSKRNINEIKSLFESIIRGVGTITIFGGDTNNTASKPPSYFLGNLSKKTLICTANRRKDFSIVGCPNPAVHLLFKETALSFFLNTQLQKQAVTVFPEDSTTLSLIPSQLFIARPQPILARSLTRHDCLNEPAKNLSKEIKEKLFKTEQRCFYIANVDIIDKIDLKVALENFNLQLNLYEDIKNLIRIRVHDNEQAEVFIDQVKNLTGRDLIYTKRSTKHCSTFTNLFFPLDIFKKFCDELGVSETTTGKFIHTLNDVQRFEMKI